MRRPDLPDLNGILLIHKAGGMTSHDVVARVRRVVGMKRVGHGGTLDPFATGLLVVAVGRATRVLQYVQDSDKRYLAHIVLGVDTDTHDIEGAVTQRSTIAVWPDHRDVRQALNSFIGPIEQIPPAHSAIKVGGRKLYERARAGEQVDVPVREVEIREIEICAYDPPHLLVAVHCGKGTYIRSLARDIGHKLGSGAYCHTLCRTAIGSLSLDMAWTLEELAEMDAREHWPEVALHPDAAVLSLPGIILNPSQTRAWYHGRSVPVAIPDDLVLTLPVRVYGESGAFLGIGTIGANRSLSPSLVFPELDEGNSS